MLVAYILNAMEKYLTFECERLNRESPEVIKFDWFDLIL